MKFYKIPGWNYLDETEDGHFALGADAEQAANERDAYKKAARDMEECVDNVREAMGLESTHYLVLHDDVRDMRLKGEQAAKDAVKMAKLAQQAIYELYDGKAAHTRDLSYKEAQAIIERYEGGQE